MIVVDASAVVDLLFESPATSGVEWHLQRAQRWIAPEDLLVEVSSALWRLVRAGRTEAGTADAMVERLTRLPITLLSHRELLPAAWGFRDSNRMADCFYLACAQVTGAPLLTTDQRMGRSHPGVTTIVVT